MSDLCLRDATLTLTSMLLPKAEALATKVRMMKDQVEAVTLQIWTVLVLKAESLTPTVDVEMTTNLVEVTRGMALTNLEDVESSNPAVGETDLVTRGEAVEDTSLESIEVGVNMKEEGVAINTQTMTGKDSMNTETKEVALANLESSQDPTMNLLLLPLSRVGLVEEVETHEVG